MGPWIIPSSYRYWIFRFMVQFYPLSNHQEAFLLYEDLYCASPHLTDVPKVQQLSGDTWAPPRQRTEQEVLEEVILHSTEVRALFLQQGDFQG